MRSSQKRLFVLTVLLKTTCVSASATIYGGGSFAGGPGGAGGISSQTAQLNPGVCINPEGQAIFNGTQYYYSSATTNPTADNNIGYVFDGTALNVLQPIGMRPSGHPNSETLYAINSSGMVSGSASNSSFTVFTATRWDSGGNPTALQPIGVSTSGTHNSGAFGYALNDAGIVAGSSTQYGNVSGASNLGSRPVFWPAGSSVPTQLGVFNTGNYFGQSNYSSGAVQSINSSGAMVGYAERFVASSNGTGADLGNRATLWAAGGGQAIELPSLGADPSGSVSSFARVINSSGVVGGYSTKFSGTTFLGQLPVRWTSPTTVQQLQTMGTSASGTTSGDVVGINFQGDVVGTLNNYDNSGNSLGSLPELWKAGGTAATPLGLLGTSSTGISGGNARNINDAQYTVGSINDYSTGGDSFGTSVGTTVATLWASDGSVTDLNTVIQTVAPNSSSPGWILLTEADGINNAGWVSGLGTYNPGNGLPTYTRGFLIQGTVWNRPGSGSWNDPASWALTIPNSVGATASFLSAITADATVSVPTSETVGSMVFDNAHRYTVAGAGPITLTAFTGPAAINVSTGSHNVQTPLIYTAGLTVSTNSDPAVGTPSLTLPLNITGTGLFVKAGPGSLVFAGSSSGITKLSLPAIALDTGTLQLGDGMAQNARTVLNTTSLSISGVLDLRSNDLLLQGGGVIGLSSVTTYLKQGYNASGGGNWSGSTGIVSSKAGSDAHHLTTLGSILNSSDQTTGGTAIYSNLPGSLGLFDGVDATNTDVLVKYTYYGDANLDGKVDGSDYSLIDSGYLGHQSGWYNGDFNYDGIIDGSDYTLIDNAFNTQGAQVTAVIASSTALPVPEPAAMTLIGLVGTGLLSNRKRRNASTGN